MKVEHITNASFLFTLSDGLRILSDPWYHDGIYHGILFNYPKIPEAVKKHYIECQPDYIYISHIHQDHFDENTLQHIDKNIPIVIGEFPIPNLINALKQLGFNEIIQKEFDAVFSLHGHEVCIFSQFSGSSDNIDNETNIPVDTSIYIKDKNGDSVFFAVDNPMQEKHAIAIKQRFGEIDCAILAYSGASIYPFVFEHYSEVEKNRRCDELKESRLTKFCRLAELIGAKVSIPAAGSFVLAGVAHQYARYQHQAAPAEIKSAWQACGHEPERLIVMSTGDSLDLASMAYHQSSDALDRDFSHQDRIDYATSLKDFPCELHQISWPKDLRLPLVSLLRRARAQMWQAQQRLSCYPESDAYFTVYPEDDFNIPGYDQLCVKIAFDSDQIVTSNVHDFDTRRPRIEYKFSVKLLMAILMGSTYWNVAEYHMVINREPDVFKPATLSLFANFKV